MFLVKKREIFSQLLSATRNNTTVFQTIVPAEKIKSKKNPQPAETTSWGLNNNQKID
jgi:hypothetical protein